MSPANAIHVDVYSSPLSLSVIHAPPDVPVHSAPAAFVPGVSQPCSDRRVRPGDHPAQNPSPPPAAVPIGSLAQLTMPPDLSSLHGGSLLLAWQLRDKHVLIVGGGDVASGRIESVLVADARITLISPRAGLHPLTQQFLDASDRITYHDRVFAPTDLDGVDMVLTAIDDVDISRQICALCRERKIPVNVADIPPSCDFYFGSQIRSGPLQIMISTNGRSPKLANIIRKKIEACIPEHAGDAIEKVGELRSKLKERAPGVGGDVGKRRMRWMIDVCSSWDMDELAMLDDNMIARLLDEGWEKNQVPKIEDVGGHANKSDNHSLPPQALLLPTALGFVVGIASTAAVLLIRRR